VGTAARREAQTGAPAMPEAGAGRAVGDLDTPVLLVDLDATERNIERAQNYCDEHGYALRPHIKSHKSPEIARLQLSAGAVGITCQKIGEAEVMADAGVENILLTYPVIGDQKADRLRELAARCSLSVAADSSQALGYTSYAGRTSGREIGFLVECDTGGGRLGVQTPAAAAALAEEAAKTPGVVFRGLMTYPTSTGTRAFMEEASDILSRLGLAAEVISGGGTPVLYRTHELGGVTEIRVGEYVFGDRAALANGVTPLEDLAARVATTVVGRPTADRGILDAGSKSLSSDLVEAEGVSGYGLILEYPDAVIYAFSEEHAHVDFSGCQRRPQIGDRVTVVPNHVCACVNLHDEFVLHRGDEVVDLIPVSARGRIR
jgi:D-serine deaminase-like pyridoxal phosphate-dependent protein